MCFIKLLNECGFSLAYEKQTHPIYNQVKAY